MPRLGPPAALIANSLWTAVLQVAFIPFYLRILGPESFGLLGISMLVRTILMALDLGIISTTNREFARYIGGTHDQDENTLRTSELWIAATTLISASIVIAGANLVAERWVTTAELSEGDVALSLRLMALGAGLQVIAIFYQSGLMGLHRHTLAAATNALSTTIIFVGAAMVLLWTSDVRAYFGFHLVAAAAQAGLFAWLFYRIKPFRAGRFSWSVARRLRTFAFPLAATSALGAVLSQADKIVLTKMLKLDVFGDYTVASAVAGGIPLLAAPVFSFIYPTLAAAVVRGEASLRESYAGATDLMSFVVLPVAAVLSLFPKEVVWAWTGNDALAQRVAPVIGLLVAGSAINSLGVVPYALQLASGMSRLALGIGCAVGAIFAPILVFLSMRLGMEGAAMWWLGLNAAQLMISVPLTHRIALKSDSARWLFRGLVMPVAVVFGTAALWSFLGPEQTSRESAFIRMGFAALLSLIAATAVLPNLSTHFSALRAHLRTPPSTKD